MQILLFGHFILFVPLQTRDGQPISSVAFPSLQSSYPINKNYYLSFKLRIYIPLQRLKLSIQRKFRQVNCPSGH